MYRWRLLFLAVLACIGYLLASCGGENSNPIISEPKPVVDTTGPYIVSTTPDSGEINVTRTKTFQAIFSEPLDPLSINDSIFFLDDSTYGTVTQDSNILTLEILPNTGINYLHRPMILGSIADTAGNLMGQDYGWIFRTSPAFDLTDFIGEFRGIYTVIETDTDTFPKFHYQPILWSFTDSEFSMRVDPLGVIDTTLKTCAVSGSFVLDSLDLYLTVNSSIPDTSGGFLVCDDRWNPEGPFKMVRITAFTNTIEFWFQDSLNSYYKNIRIDRK